MTSTTHEQLEQRLGDQLDEAIEIMLEIQGANDAN